MYYIMYGCECVRVCVNVHLMHLLISESSVSLFDCVFFGRSKQDFRSTSMFECVLFVGCRGGYELRLDKRLRVLDVPGQIKLCLEYFTKYAHNELISCDLCYVSLIM